MYTIYRKRFTIHKIFYLLFANMMVVSCVFAQESTTSAESTLPAPVKMTAQEDHRRMMELLNITSIRPGRNGMNPQAENYANYDESKANPYPDLPDPLVLKNGDKVTTAEMWWKQRRPEIVEDFDREIYGRVPKDTPGVNWEVTNTTRDTNGVVPTITKQLTGHVDNSSYPLITVDIRLSLTTPANAAGPVYRLLGKKDMGTTEFPPIETTLIDGDVAFRQHSGMHTDGPNWPTFLTFARRYIKGLPVPATSTQSNKKPAQ